MTDQVSICSACGKPGETVRLGLSPEPLCRGCARDKAGHVHGQERKRNPPRPKYGTVEREREVWKHVLDGTTGPGSTTCKECHVRMAMSVFRWHEKNAHAFVTCLWCGGRVVRGDVDAGGKYPERTNSSLGIRWEPPAFCSARCLFSARQECFRCRKAPPRWPEKATPCQACFDEVDKPQWSRIAAAKHAIKKGKQEDREQEMRDLIRGDL